MIIQQQHNNNNETADYNDVLLQKFVEMFSTSPDQSYKTSCDNNDDVI